MSPAHALLLAVTFVWLGMVLAISFLEAPLKFRAPGVTVAIGLAIGRLVFRALNTVEVMFAVVVLAAAAMAAPEPGALAALVTAVTVLAVQIIAVRPALASRSDQVLAGLEAPRSRGHLVYVGLEAVKVVALFAGGVLLL